MAVQYFIVSELTCTSFNHWDKDVDWRQDRPRRPGLTDWWQHAGLATVMYLSCSGQTAIEKTSVTGFDLQTSAVRKNWSGTEPASCHCGTFIASVSDNILFRPLAPVSD